MNRNLVKFTILVFGFSNLIFLTKNKTNNIKIPIETGCSRKHLF